MTQMNQRNLIVEAFGQHLTMEGYGCPEGRLMDLERLYRFLEYTPDQVQMTKIMPPYVFKYRGKVEADWGVSGFVLIAESHISIHTFPDKGFFTLDLFSCKPFDHLLVVELATREFAPTKCDFTMTDRGLEFPRDKEAVTEFMEGERASMAG